MLLLTCIDCSTLQGIAGRTSVPGCPGTKIQIQIQCCSSCLGLESWALQAARCCSCLSIPARWLFDCSATRAALPMLSLTLARSISLILLIIIENKWKHLIVGLYWQSSGVITLEDALTYPSDWPDSRPALSKMKSLSCLSATTCPSQCLWLQCCWNSWLKNSQRSFLSPTKLKHCPMSTKMAAPPSSWMQLCSRIPEDCFSPETRSAMSRWIATICSDWSRQSLDWWTS